MSKLHFEYDDGRDILTIEAVAYSGVLFRTLGNDGPPVGTIVEITDRKDGVVTLTRIFDAKVRGGKIVKR